MKYTKLEITGGKLPTKLGVAFSGGVDSVAALDYLSKGRDITIIFVDHVTDNLSHVADFANDLSKEYSANLIVKKISGSPPNNSHECWWRDKRYEIFHSLDMPVVTAHHLDDCVENWIWTSLRGSPSVIPYRNKNVVRPFRTVSKQGLINWANRKELKWIEDQSNNDVKYTRNFIRHNMIDMSLKVNPGLHTMVRNMVIKGIKYVPVN